MCWKLSCKAVTQRKRIKDKDKNRVKVEGSHRTQGFRRPLLWSHESHSPHNFCPHSGQSICQGVVMHSLINPRQWLKGAGSQGGRQTRERGQERELAGAECRTVALLGWPSHSSQGVDMASGYGRSSATGGASAVVTIDS